MKDNPLIISLLVGLIVILVIGGVSLLVKMNREAGVKDQLQTEKMSLDKTLGECQTENSNLQKTVEQLNARVYSIEKESKEKIAVLNEENERLKLLNKRLEDSLKDELMKQKLGVEE